MTHNFTPDEILQMARDDGMADMTLAELKAARDADLAERDRLIAEKEQIDAELRRRGVDPEKIVYFPQPKEDR